MKKFVVKLFIIGLSPSLQQYRYEEVEAENEDEALKLAHDMYYPEGWGVYSAEEIKH